MIAVARAARRTALLLTLAAILASLSAGSVVAYGTTIRLEAGVHKAVTFSTTWAVTGTRSLTLNAPATVTGARRYTVPNRGVYLKIASGALSGWWVREGRMAYIVGIYNAKVYSPDAAGRLVAGRYELYRFDAAWAMSQARGRTVGATGVSFHADRSAVINGRQYVRIAGGTWAGWWMPGTLAAPSRITCVAGTPPTGTAGRIVRSVSSATGEIALTFDMGGRLVPAVSIVRFLELERICATIFPTAVSAQTTTGRQVMAEIAAHPELFELGNHTVHHCNLRDGGGGAACPATRPSSAFVKAELQDADAVFRTLAGRSSVPYWRPPYAAVDTTLVNVAAGAGYPYTVMWSTDTIDWRPVADGGPTASQIVAKVVANRKAGAIVLMHLGGYHTRDALPAMIDGLRGAGYTPTTLSGLYR
jgi:peptidoglycan/xylan/chitin deacetylase (PgdA/CDA1 family)